MADSGAPDVVEDLALAAFRMVKDKLGFELDFTPDTLPVLDHYLRALAQEDRGKPDEKVVAVVGPCAGAYFGEVARRRLDGLRWHCPADDYQKWRLEATHAFLSFNPIGAALEALYGEPLADWGAHLSLLPAQRSAVTRSLEATGPVRGEDFYRLAIRYEVLEQTLGVLRGVGDGEPVDPEVYALLVDGKASDVEA